MRVVAVACGLLIAALVFAGHNDTTVQSSVPSIDPAFAADFEVADEEGEDVAEDVPLAAPAAVEPVVSTFKPCDPDDFNPEDFAGKVSNKLNDVPNPGCEQLPNCAQCIAKRQCGWCAVAKSCVNTRSKSPECAFNENTDVCAPACEQMWRIQWPVGRERVLEEFCSAMEAAYAAAPPDSENPMKHILEKM